MIENFSKDEINLIISELKMRGYEVKASKKNMLLEQEAEKLGMNNCFLCSRLSGAIYSIADWATDNHETRGKRTYHKNTVKPEVETEYRRICSEILKVIQPYYGKEGFRVRNF